MSYYKYQALIYEKIIPSTGVANLRVLTNEAKTYCPGCGWPGLEIAKNLTVGTAPKSAVAADLYGSNEFKRYVFRFIAKYWKQINANDRHKWIESNPALLSQILNAI